MNRRSTCMRKKRDKWKTADRYADFLMKCAEPFVKISQFQETGAMWEGFRSCFPITTFGSILLFLWLFIDGRTGTVFSIQLDEVGMILKNAIFATYGLYPLFLGASVGGAYGERLNLPQHKAEVIALGTILIQDYENIKSCFLGEYAGTVNILFSLASAMLSIRLYQILERKLQVKEGETFWWRLSGEIIPVLQCCVILGVPLVLSMLGRGTVLAWFQEKVVSLAGALDNGFFYCLDRTLSGITWAAGLSYEGLMGNLTLPLEIQWLTENSMAAAKGTELTTLPHIWVLGSFTWSNRPCFAYPLIFFMLCSKCGKMKEIGKRTAVPTIFCACESLMFGVPVCLNPYLMIPYVLSCFAGSLNYYIWISMGWCNRICVSAPWTFPCTLSGFIQTGGDPRSILLIVSAFIIGCLIYYPWFRVYERFLMRQEENTSVRKEKENG